MIMKPSALVALAAVASLIHVQPLARAAETNAPAPAAAGGAAGLRERMQETAKELNLTEEQKQKLQAILREKLEKLRGLKDDTSLTREEKMEKIKAVREEITSEVKNILTPDQFDKWKAKQGLLLGAPAAASNRSAAPVARLQEAIKELNLTDTQKEQLKPLYEEQMGKLRDLRQDGTMSMAEKLEKLQSLQQEIGPKLKKVLDAEQYSKWEKDAKQWMEELKKRFAGAQQN